MPEPHRILIDAPDEATILAARHLDATEGPVQIGEAVVPVDRSAINQVLRYISRAHNADTEPNPGDAAKRIELLEISNRNLRASVQEALERAGRAEADLQRLRAGEEDGGSPLTEPTPGQWLRQLNQATAEQRLNVIRVLREDSARGQLCRLTGHEQRLEEDRHAWMALARVRDVIADMEGVTGARHWARILRQAIDGEEPQPEKSADTAAELIAEEARDLADDLATQLYQAQDALAFVAECCDITDREQRSITTADVREWLKGARCGQQLAADKGPGFTIDPDAPPPAFITASTEAAGSCACGHTDPWLEAETSTCPMCDCQNYRPHASTATETEPHQTKCSCFFDPFLTTGIDFAIRCPHCPPAMASIPAAEWIGHMQSRHPQTAEWIGHMQSHHPQDVPHQAAADLPQLLARITDGATAGAELAERHHRLGTELQHWQTRIIPGLRNEAEAAEQRAAHLAGTLTDVLNTFSTVYDEPGGTIFGYLTEAPIHPDDMARWRTALNPQEQP